MFKLIRRFAYCCEGIITRIKCITKLISQKTHVDCASYFGSSAIVRGRFVD